MTKHSHHNPETLHELLAERRAILDISLQEVAEKTAIPAKHLQRIERGEWRRLPPSVYTKGFLRKYARLVGCNPDEVVRSYETLQKNSADTQENTKQHLFDRLAFSPKMARVAGALVVLALIVGYAGYQLRTVVAHPDLTITQPAQQEIVVSTDSVVLKGQTQPGTEVFLNQQPVGVGTDGAFQEQVELLPGVNTLVVTAVSRFNKETRIERRIIYTP